VKALNLYLPHAYSTILDQPRPELLANLDRVKDEGVVPEQLFTSNHLPRFAERPARYSFSDRQFSAFSKLNCERVRRMSFLRSDLLAVTETGRLLQVNSSTVISEDFRFSLISFSRGCWCLAFIGDNSVTVVDSSKRESITTRITWITALANSSEDIAIGGFDGCIEIHHLATNTSISRRVHNSGVCDISCCHELSLIASISEDNELALIDVMTGDIRWNECYQMKLDRVFVIREGLVILRSGSTYRAMDLAGRVCASVALDSEVVCESVLEMDDFACYLGVGTRDGLTVLSDYDLHAVKYDLGITPVDLALCPATPRLFVLLEGNSLIEADLRE
jgi:WD40 repeat protein